jgi:hypothetical protein
MSTLTAGNVTVSCSLSADTSGNLVFQSGGNVTAMTIDSSQNVGIGTTSPTVYGSYRTLEVRGTGGGLFQIGTGATTAAYLYQDGTNSGFTNLANGAMTFGTNNTERARITSGGDLLLGTTNAPNYGSRLRVQGGIETQGFNQYNIVATTSGSDFEWVLRTGARQLFYVNNAAVVANLSTTGVWTNASDARYKENITDSGYGLDAVMALKPRTYNLIDQTDKPQIGFIAQEVLDVVPEVVDSTYNSITEEDRYTLSYGQLTAVLTKAIQEQQQMIEELKAKVAALEAA